MKKIKIKERNMKKIFFIMVLMCMILSCNTSKSSEEIPDDLKIYQESGIEETIKYLEKMGKTEPLNKSYYLAKMGYYYIEEKDYEKAEAVLKEALKANPNEGYAYNELGYLYSIQEKHEMALETYVKGSEKDPEMGGNFYGAGVLYSDMKDYDKAEKNFEKALALYKKAEVNDKADKAARQLYFTYLNKGERDKARQFLNDSVSKGLDQGYFYSQLANFYYEEKNFEQALKYNLKGLKADPDEAENYFGAGVNYYYKRNNKQALKYLEMVVPMYKKSQNLDYLGDAYAYLYKINIEEGNKDKADEIEAAAGQELGKENWEKKKF